MDEGKVNGLSSLAMHYFPKELHCNPPGWIFFHVTCVVFLNPCQEKKPKALSFLLGFICIRPKP